MGKTKKFPKRPEDLWKKKTAKDGSNDLLAVAKALKRQFDKEARVAKMGKTVTTMREES